LLTTAKTVVSVLSQLHLAEAPVQELLRQVLAQILEAQAAALGRAATLLQDLVFFLKEITAALLGIFGKAAAVAAPDLLVQEKMEAQESHLVFQERQLVDAAAEAVDEMFGKAAALLEVAAALEQAQAELEQHNFLKILEKMQLLTAVVVAAAVDALLVETAVQEL